MSLRIEKYSAESAEEKHAAYVRAMWLQFLRTPANPLPDADGMFDLGEVGQSKSDGKILRWCPYSPADGIVDPE